MNKAKFPHLLKLTRKDSKTYLHFVSDTPPEIGDSYPLMNLGPLGFTKDGKPLNGEVTAIVRSREAKGNWTGWPTHPNWYLLDINIYHQLPPAP